MVEQMEIVNTRTRMTEEQVFEEFRSLVAGSLHIEPEQVTRDAYLDDLGAESLDLIEISMEVESRFKVWLPEKSILETAIEVSGPGVVEQNGVLTEFGKAMLRARALEGDATRFEGDVAVRDVHKYFQQVRTWVRMIEALLEYVPAACPSCGGVLEPGLGFKLKCTQCQSEATLRSGDEINREWVEDYRRASGQATHTGTPAGEPAAI